MDPLTSDWYRVMRDREWNEGCDCGAPEAALHHCLCGVTPIFGRVCEEYGLPRIDMPLAAYSCTCPSWGNPSWPHRHGCPMVTV